MKKKLEKKCTHGFLNCNCEQQVKREVFNDLEKINRMSKYDMKLLIQKNDYKELRKKHLKTKELI